MDRFDDPNIARDAELVPDHLHDLVVTDEQRAAVVKINLSLMAFIRISGPIPLASAIVIATIGFPLVDISGPPADLLVGWCRVSYTAPRSHVNTTTTTSPLTGGGDQGYQWTRTGYPEERCATIPAERTQITL